MQSRQPGKDLIAVIDVQYGFYLVHYSQALVSTAYLSSCPNLLPLDPMGIHTFLLKLPPQGIRLPLLAFVGVGKVRNAPDDKMREVIQQARRLLLKTRYLVRPAKPISKGTASHSRNCGGNQPIMDGGTVSRSRDPIHDLRWVTMAAVLAFVRMMLRCTEQEAMLATWETFMFFIEESPSGVLFTAQDAHPADGVGFKNDPSNNILAATMPIQQYIPLVALSLAAFAVQSPEFCQDTDENTAWTCGLQRAMV
ncbi:hypothetical protein ETB97_009822 [Aspergillus alliaceus]|uniref:Uncharacterized protein n=1 Tax=Petromyces alliaceus TaxID=209559 RepID=A0A8H6ACZ1_PETAA|nr:hypothetical protein ETB97_009822 [Aspergillus burnettii]